MIDPPPSFSSCPVCGSGVAPMKTNDGWKWLRCQECGFVYLADGQPLTAQRDLQASGAASYISGYERKFRSKMNRSFRRAALMRLLRPRGGELLDVGSNCGFMVEAASRLGFNATGIEPSTMMIDWARKRFPGGNFLEGMLEEVSLPAGGYDVVYCSEVIEHTVDARDFAGRLAILLRPGGLLFLTTPHIREYEKRGLTDMGAPDHRNYFDFSNLTRLLVSVGFKSPWYKPTFGKGIVALATRR